MRHRKRYILTKGLIVTPRTLDEFVQTLETRKQFIYLSVPCLISADAQQRFGARIHIHDAIAGRDNDQRCRQVFQDGIGRRDGRSLFYRPPPAENGVGTGGSVLFGLFGFRTDVLSTVKLTVELSISVLPEAS